MSEPISYLSLEEKLHVQCQFIRKIGQIRSNDSYDIFNGIASTPLKKEASFKVNKFFQIEVLKQMQAF